ncbi:hypothetical protein [Planctomicrobium sp. SH664]|uniref:hypothetical protein n=1 Tax=Planctomicrobium sp. SH664 TaxID=3448125 RepID=UPI003F5C5215
MEAKLLKIGAFCALLLTTSHVGAATYSTPNFTVTATTDDVARRVGECAEFWRKELAEQWLGRALPNWYKPCPISVKVGQIGAGGQTTFTFENGEVFGWKMQVQGSLERVLDSVIPHEVNHTIFASHFRRPLPRWADEGAATLFEHDSEKARQLELLERVFHTSRRIPLQKLLAIKDYPSDMQDVLTLYAEGFSLAEFLVGQKGGQGRQVYLQFLNDAHQQGWEVAIRKHYGYQSINTLEESWGSWILAGSPSFNLPAEQQLAQNDAPSHSVAQASIAEPVVRGQSPVADPVPLPPVSRRLRNAASNAVDAENAVQTAELPLERSVGATDSRDSFRTRVGEQPTSRPSPPSSSLSPTADGIEVDLGAKSYAFPAARR